MFIEDIIIVLEQVLNDTTVHCSAWERAFVRSVADWVRDDRALSIKQADKVRHLITTHAVILTARLGPEVRQPPDYRNPLFEAKRVPREVRHLGDNLLGFRFKLDLMVKTALQQLYDPHGGRAISHFNRQFKLWVVPVTAQNLRSIQHFIVQHKFTTDHPTRTYLTAAAEAIGQSASAVLTDDRAIILLTVPDNDLLAAWAIEIAGGICL